MPIILWPVLWILAMVALIAATTIAAAREKKTRVKAASQAIPMQMAQESATPLDGGEGFGDSFGATDAGFGDDPFK
jgi:hypothetical protein